MTDSASRVHDVPSANSPTRLEIDRVATEIVAEYGSVIMGDAYRFSANREDAEDAYQRSLELLLTKSPTSDREQVLPWLRTVVRNEALQIAQSRQRREIETSPERFESFESASRDPESAAEAASEIEMGFEALGRLTQDQIKCLLAQAEGLDYEEIATRTGFTRRKVTRCLEHGREAFAKRFEAIAAGSECERMQPLIRRVLESDAAAALELRPHLRHCLACRGRLRAYESAPRKVAAMLPPALLVTSAAPNGFIARAFGWWESLEFRLASRMAAPDRWSELAAAKKVAAVAAISVAAAGGGVAAEQALDTGRSLPAGDARSARLATPVEPRAMFDELSVPARKRHSPKRRRKSSYKQPTASQVVSKPRVEQSADAAAANPTPADDGSAEFSPETRSVP